MIHFFKVLYKPFGKAIDYVKTSYQFFSQKKNRSPINSEKKSIRIKLAPGVKKPVPPPKILGNDASESVKGDKNPFIYEPKQKAQNKVISTQIKENSIEDGRLKPNSVYSKESFSDFFNHYFFIGRKVLKGKSLESQQNKNIKR